MVLTWPSTAPTHDRLRLADRDKRMHVEIADHRPGVGWLAPRLAELVDRWRPLAVAYDAAGPALDVADQAQRFGVELEGLKARDYAAACSGLLREVVDGTFKYRPHPALDDAAASAGRRSLGDAWAWGRRMSSRVAVTAHRRDGGDVGL